MSRTMTYAQAFALGVREEMERDPSIFVMGTDLLDRGGAFGQLNGIGEIFGPERVRDTPISESAMMSAGLGAAINGMRPIVDINFVDFSFGAWDEIVNQTAKMRYMLGVPIPLVLRGTVGVAAYAMQHNNQIETMFAHVPGLLVVMPATPADTKGLIKTALRGEDPVVFLMHKRLGAQRGEVGGPDELVPFGRARVAREGSDITLVAYSFMVRRALETAEQLAADGISAEVIDMRTIVPLDLETVEESVRKTRHAVVIGEAPRFLGVGAEVAASIQETLFRDLAAPVQRVGASHAPIPHSPPLYEAIIPQVEGIVRAAKAALAH
jgi:pyruvate dehydrogenase E1 component beta subunit